MNINWTAVQEYLLPEELLLFGIILTLVFSLFSNLKNYAPFVAALSLFSASISAAGLLMKLKSYIVEDVMYNTSLFSGLFNSDTFSLYFRAIIYAVTFLIVLASIKYMQNLESPAEYYAILLTAALGAGFLTGANDLLAIFVALETLGLGSILLASYARKSQKSNEGGIKYLLSSATATSMFLLASSFLYGIVGTTNLNAIGSYFRIQNSFALAEKNPNILYQMSDFFRYNIKMLEIQGLDSAAMFSDGLKILVVVLIIAAIAFKLGAAPLQNWSPDVYTGAPTTTTVFLSVVSKTAAIALAIRLIQAVLGNISIVVGGQSFAGLLLASLAVLSIVIGNTVGLIQMISRGSAKRMLAYSSIAQAGYLLIGLAIFSPKSVASLVVYLTIYAVMNTGAFIALINFEEESKSESIYDLAGLIQKRPMLTLAFVLCLINLAALPFIPAAFIAKFYLFAYAFSSYAVYGKTLAIIGLIGSIVALYYYLYFAKIMVVDAPSNAVQSLDTKGESQYLYVALVLATIALATIGLFCAQDLFSVVDMSLIGFGI